MREKHPIDDLFRRVLRDAEAAPPPAVWEGVVRRRHWGHRLLLQLERRWGLALLLVLLLSGSTAWWALREPEVMADRHAQAPHVRIAESEAGRSQDAPAEQIASIPAEPSISLDNGTTSASSDASVEMDDGDAQAEDGAAQGQGVRVNPTDHAMGDPGSALPVRTIANAPASKMGDRGAIRNGEARTDEGPSHVFLASSVPMERVNSMALDRMLGIRSSYHRVDPGAGELEHLPPPDQYVLPSGSYWLGLEIGYADVNGAWQGSSPLVDDLNTAEEWRDQWSLGLLFGRRWRSGTGVSLGLALVDRRSRFLHEQHQNGLSTTSVDTVWVITPGGVNDTVYTWNIVTTSTSEPGVEQLHSATNSYTLLHIPLEVGWRQEARRWSYGVRGGLVLGATMARTGRTLIASPTDGTPDLVDLGDPATDGRFGLSIAGSIAAEGGYLISERWSAHMGPVFTWDLWSSGNDPSLRSSSIGAFLRVEYELPFKEKRIERSEVE